MRAGGSAAALRPRGVVPCGPCGRHDAGLGCARDGGAARAAGELRRPPRLRSADRCLPIGASAPRPRRDSVATALRAAAASDPAAMGAVAGAATAGAAGAAVCSGCCRWATCAGEGAGPLPVLLLLLGGIPAAWHGSGPWCRFLPLTAPQEGLHVRGRRRGRRQMLGRAAPLPAPHLHDPPSPNAMIVPHPSIRCPLPRHPGRLPPSLHPSHDGPPTRIETALLRPTIALSLSVPAPSPRPPLMPPPTLLPPPTPRFIPTAPGRVRAGPGRREGTPARQQARCSARPCASDLTLCTRTPDRAAVGRRANALREAGPKIRRAARH
jgi:hypothetical protein